MKLRIGVAACVMMVVGCSKAPEKDVDLGALPPPPAITEQQRQLALERGRAIAQETFDLLRTNLQVAIQSGGISNALPYCSLAASPLTAGMAAKHGVTLRRVTHKARGPGGRADTNELSVLRAFEAALAAHGPTPPPSPIVTNGSPGNVTFFAPILIGNELCLRCHGEPGSEIQAADLAVIQRLYPDDKAVGFKMGQLRGAWRIDFPGSSLPIGTPK